MMADYFDNHAEQIITSKLSMWESSQNTTYVWIGVIILKLGQNYMFRPEVAIIRFSRKHLRLN
jgi:hypothetical protein